MTVIMKVLSLISIWLFVCVSDYLRMNDTYIKNTKTDILIVSFTFEPQDRGQWRWRIKVYNIKKCVCVK